MPTFRIPARSVVHESVEGKPLDLGITNGAHARILREAMVFTEAEQVSPTTAPMQKMVDRGWALFRRASGGSIIAVRGSYVEVL